MSVLAELLCRKEAREATGHGDALPRRKRVEEITVALNEGHSAEEVWRQMQ